MALLRFLFNIEFNFFDIFTNSIDRLLDEELRNFVFEENFDHLEDVKVTLTEEQFGKFNTEIQQNQIEGKQCHVCLENLILDEKLTELTCKHIFHKDCIKNWLVNCSNKCPMCRVTF